VRHSVQTLVLGTLWVVAFAAGPVGQPVLADEALPLLLPETECADGAKPCPSPDAPEELGTGLSDAGSLAPSFRLTDVGGAPISFRAGEDTVPRLLIFWSLFCPPCQEEMPLFVDLALRHPPPELQVIAVNLDGTSLARSVAQYARAEHFPFPAALDEKQGDRFVVAGRYGVTGTPSLVLIDATGTVVWSYEGRVDALELESAILDGLR